MCSEKQNKKGFGVWKDNVVNLKIQNEKAVFNVSGNDLELAVAIPSQPHYRTLVQNHILFYWIVSDFEVTMCFT